MAQMSHSIRDWYPLYCLRLHHLCLKGGCVVILTNFSASAALTLIPSAPISHSLISHSQAVRDSFVVYLMLFLDFWNSWVKFFDAIVSQQTIVKTPVCMQVQDFSLSLYQRSDLGYLLLLLGYSFSHHYLTPQMGSRFEGHRTGSVLLI